MTLDEMKLARDGHLWHGRSDQPRPPYIRPIYDRMERAPNGDTYCTYPQGGTVVYGEPNAPQNVQGPVELLYDVRALGDTSGQESK